MNNKKHPLQQSGEHHETNQEKPRKKRSEKIKKLLKTINIFEVFQEIHALEKENERLMNIIKKQQEIIRKKDAEIASQEKNLPYLKYQTEEEKKKKQKKKSSWRDEIEQELMEYQ